MIRRPLKTHIIINVAILLVFGMAMVEVIATVAFQRMLVQQKINTALRLIEVTRFQMNPSRGRDTLRRMVLAQGADCYVLIDAQGHDIGSEPPACGISNDLREHAVRAFKGSGPVVAYAQSTWGVFWKQPRFLLMAAVVAPHDESIAMAWDLKPLYRRIRQAQPAMIAYIFINTIILTMIGLVLLWAVTGRPIARLVRRAEAFTTDEDLFLMTGSSNNEFEKLSRSLNSMLNRIGQDRESLRAAVRSLEQTNQELIRAQNDVVRAEKLASAGLLASGIAHEIGNPIGIVLGYLDLIAREGIDEGEKADFIARAQDEIQRINMIIRQLLDIARPGDAVPAPVSVHGVIESLLDVVRHQPSLSGIRVDLSFDAPQDTVVADAGQLRQVFLNLILNASDAIAEGRPGTGILAIRTRRHRISESGPDSGDQAYVQVCFQDNGIGFPQGDQGNVFDPFFTTKAPGKGTGLGLSVCLSIVQGLGGSIQAQSETGAGTIVTVDLPLARHFEGPHPIDHGH
jgi:two-component system, NtrC family, sensor kinase